MKSFSVMLAAILVTTIQGKAYSFGMPESYPLPQTITKANVIIMGQMRGYVSDPTDQVKFTSQRDSGGRIFYTGPNYLIASTTLKVRGQYTFQVLQTLKGECEPSLTVNLPRISSYYYNGAKLRIEEGSEFLLLLQRDAKGQLTPVDATVPLIPLTNEVHKQAQDEEHDVQARVIGLMLSSLSDPINRRANTDLLHKIVDPQMVLGLAPYLNDPDTETCDNILYALAINQQVAVIPRILELERKVSSAKNTLGSDVKSLLALQHFTTPEAVPYLNPMLFAPYEYVRLNAMFALDNLADQDSIPYFLLSLRDPDHQKLIAPGAYAMLHKLTSVLGPIQDEQYFFDHRQETIQLMTAWWQDELAGKHPAPANPDAPALPAPKTMPKLDNLTPQQAVPLLNPLLFERSLNTRQQAMTALTKLADQSSIPYLLIALYDPDKGVAYAAYQTLHRLISEVGPAKPQAEFVTQQETEIKPLYDWWQDELRGLHTTDTTALISIAESDKEGAYKAYKKLHQLVPELGATKDEATFYAHPREEIQALEQWRSEQWKKAHPQPVAAPARP